MKIFKHPDPNFNENIRDIYEDHIIKCRYFQDPKELEIMEQKAREFAQGISFKDYAQELIFKDAFIKGYLCAFIVTDEEQDILNSLTELGKAMAEK